MCRGGKATSIGRWVGRGESAKKKYKITVLRNKVGVFLRKIVVHLRVSRCLAPFLYHRRMASGTLLVFKVKKLQSLHHAVLTMFTVQLLDEQRLDACSISSLCCMGHLKNYQFLSIVICRLPSLYVHIVQQPCLTQHSTSVLSLYNTYAWITVGVCTLLLLC